jgi:hypothetical protein
MFFDQQPAMTCDDLRFLDCQFFTNVHRATAHGSIRKLQAFGDVLVGRAAGLVSPHDPFAQNQVRGERPDFVLALTVGGPLGGTGSLGGQRPSSFSRQEPRAVDILRGASAHVGSVLG